MRIDKPRVSVGLPVYNGENFIDKALDSILGQTFENFELIICDNASTDATSEICQDYAHKDERIRYHRNSKNIGGANNFNRAVELARAPYFKWMAHDDLHAGQFLEKCVDVLDDNPEVVLCFAKSGRINGNGQKLGLIKMTAKAGAASSWIRFGDLIHFNTHVCDAIFGVIRTEILRSSSMYRSFAGSDRNLLAELALYGPFYRIPEVLFYIREHPGRSIQETERHTSWFVPDHNGQYQFQLWNRVKGYVSSVKRSPLNLPERVLCYGEVVKFARHIWRPLVKEWVNAGMSKLS